MTEQEFAWLREMLHKRSGLALGPEKRYLVDSRLGSLCRAQGFGTLSALVQRMRAGDEALTLAAVEAMTTNETLFFRDGQPFVHLRETLIPALMKARASERTLRIWCAAASSGQEPYSIAMMLDEMASTMAGWRVEIVATDIAEEMLDRIRQGVYTQFEVQRGLPIQLLLKYFDKVQDRWRINEKIRRMVTVKRHNLIHPETHLGQFDLIFCRNVLIYFDVATKAKALQLLHGHLRADGRLALGSAETVMGVSEVFAPDATLRGFYAPRPQAGLARPVPPRPALTLVPAAR